METEMEAPNKAVTADAASAVELLQDDIEAAAAARMYATSSSEQSIEEDIEIAESTERSENSGKSSSLKLLEEAAAIGNSSAVSNLQKTSAEDKFRISEEQLTGCELAQHFLELKDKSAKSEEPTIGNDSTEEDVSDLLDEIEQNNKTDCDVSKSLLLQMPLSAKANFEAAKSEEIAPKLTTGKLLLVMDDAENFTIQSIDSVETALQVDVTEEQQQLAEIEKEANEDEDEEEDEKLLQVMKLRVLAMPLAKQLAETDDTNAASSSLNLEDIKPMELVPANDFRKDALEDITEESECISITMTEEPQQSLSIEQTDHNESTISNDPRVDANYTKSMANDSKQMQHEATVDATMEQQRCENVMPNVMEQPGSGRDNSSLFTNSTEYRTLQEDLVGNTMDICVELSKRDEYISKLNESLKKSIDLREELQKESEKLNEEVKSLRKQLNEAKMAHDINIQPNHATSLPCEQQTNTSTASNAAESVETQVAAIVRFFENGVGDLSNLSSKLHTQLLSLSQQATDKAMVKYQNELMQKEAEIQRLQLAKAEMERKKAEEMEELRKYFEDKCTDLEKQFSDDVFSQKSAQQSAAPDSLSDCSEAGDQMPEELVSSFHLNSKDGTPRRRSRTELLLSPSHRQMTPSMDADDFDALDTKNLVLEIAELKTFYQNKIRDIRLMHEEEIKKLLEQLHSYEKLVVEEGVVKEDCTPSTEMNTQTIEVVNNASLNEQQVVITTNVMIDHDVLNQNNESQVIQKIIEDYERRLQEQLALARTDMVHELEQQIQALLSESTADDKHWPPELILLREKFTAKSQLEIAQLQRKHAEEMSRLKLDYEKQLQRKHKRHTNFDATRNLEEVINERDDLRDVANTFRYVLVELAKLLASYGIDLNVTQQVENLFAEHNEQQALNESDLNISSFLLNSTLNNSSRIVPDVQNLLNIVEDPHLLQYISRKSNNGADELQNFDLKDCLERLKTEAAQLLVLSEVFAKRQKPISAESYDLRSGNVEHELNNRCLMAEDTNKLHSLNARRTHSLHDERQQPFVMLENKLVYSLPIDLQTDINSGESSTLHAGSAAELNFQLNELKNRLVKSEFDRQKLQNELDNTILLNSELGQELQALRSQLSQLSSVNGADFEESYGLSSPKSLHRAFVMEKSTKLLEKARIMLRTTKAQQQQNMDTTLLLQMIEDYCREGDQMYENSKKECEDLQSQIENADKKLKATRAFLEKQAAEIEAERDELLREIERLKLQLKDKEKARNNIENSAVENLKQLEAQVQMLTENLQETDAKRDKFEIELKASIDKIFDLREIITELEAQVETKTLNEQVLQDKVQHLEYMLETQTRSNETLQNEAHSTRTEMNADYQEQIRILEEKLQNMRPLPEQNLILEQLVLQLRDVETTLDEKIKTLETVQQPTSFGSCSHSAATEDVSIHADNKTTTNNRALSPVANFSPRQHSFIMDAIQRVLEKLNKLSSLQDSLMKRMFDTEMQLNNMKAACVEMQQDRELLNERLDEQSQRISVLQSKLEEQRVKTEDLQRTATAELNMRIHNLQQELQTLQETLTARDKQINAMKSQLAQSKDAIDHLEAELTVQQQPDRYRLDQLEAELQQKSLELKSLQQKIKNEMINKLALPDLMETMLADKNDEIDHLKEQLQTRENALEMALQEKSANHTPLTTQKEEISTKLSARTLSDIVSISDFDEPEFMRRAIPANDMNTPLFVPSAHSDGFLPQNVSSFKNNIGNLPKQRNSELSGLLQYNSLGNAEHKNNISSPALLPRQLRLNFSNLEKTNAEQKAEQQQEELESQLQHLQQEHKQLLAQQQKQSEELQNYQQNEAKLLKRLKDLELELLKSTENHCNENESLRKELKSMGETHAKCKTALLTVENRNKELQHLQQELQAKEERIIMLMGKLSFMEENSNDLRVQLRNLEADLDKARQQQKYSDHSSKQFSVDEIARQLEKELNYSAQLDSNILKAIESDEENNLDKKIEKTEPQGTDDENFAGEHDLLNHIEALKAQVQLERKHNDELREKLAAEKNQSQQIREQDVLIIDTMRKRLETSLEKEEELLQQLEKLKYQNDYMKTQLCALQRSESRRNSALILTSPLASPNKSPRSLEANERLLSELKLLSAQVEREKERSADMQHIGERERQRHEHESLEREEYCEQLKLEMAQLAHDKNVLSQEYENLQQHVQVQAQEIDHFKLLLSALQETEARQSLRRERQQKESSQLLAQLQEIKTKLLVSQTERDELLQTIETLRQDIARSAQRETKLAEALLNANNIADHAADASTSLPQVFFEKMQHINALLAQNTQENTQMAETVQFLVEERRKLQQKCEQLEAKLASHTNYHELEERSNRLLGRYLRVESHRKALVYQKRYLKILLQGYQDREQVILAEMQRKGEYEPPQRTNLFKTAALAIIAIQRMKYIKHVWHTGKRIVSKSVFTITQKK